MSEKIPFTRPESGLTAFNCPLCNAYADQNWRSVQTSPGYPIIVAKLRVCYCSHCNDYSVWIGEELIYPDVSGILPPNQDLNEDIQTDYLEAASIVRRSPRGAAALLRLVTQKLCGQVGKTGSINKMVGELVEDGLSAHVQKALDSVRVVGNEAVHPGQIDLKDDLTTATKLFALVNFIAEKMISEPKEIESFFEEKVPKSNKEQIEKRDGND